jgi:hypothetical protein
MDRLAALEDNEIGLKRLVYGTFFGMKDCPHHLRAAILLFLLAACSGSTIFMRTFVQWFLLRELRFDNGRDQGVAQSGFRGAQTTGSLTQRGGCPRAGDDVAWLGTRQTVPVERPVGLSPIPAAGHSERRAASPTRLESRASASETSAMVDFVRCGAL